MRLPVREALAACALYGKRRTSRICGKGLYEFVPFESTADAVLLARYDWEVSIVNKRLAVALGERCGKNIEAATHRIDVGSSLNLECQRQLSFFSAMQVFRGSRIAEASVYGHNFTFCESLFLKFAKVATRRC